MLWVVTAFVLGFAFFPNYVGYLLGGGASLAARDDLETAIVKVEGMTCEGCASGLEKALATVPGVSGAEVSYEKGQALVGYPKGKSAPRQAILTAISDEGFKGSFVETSEKQIAIEGMTCEACAAHIQSSLSKLPGVASAVVEYEKGEAKVTTDSDGPSDEALKKAIEKAGYRAGEITSIPAE